jgi:cellobiose-specific phosphotransferase system component IIA
LGRLASQRDAFQKKVDEAKAQAAAAAGETERTVAQRRTEYYQKELDDVSAQLQQASSAAVRAHAAHNNLVTLDTAVADDPVVQALVDAAKDRIGAAAVQAAVGKPLVGPYVGSQACAGCHPGPMGQWKSTPHANAYASLIGKKRQFDQECFSCHVTGAIAVGGGDVLGPTNPHQVGALTNVGCESCHGPGSAHVTDPTTPMAVPTAATCVACHDKTQDDGRFDYASYLPKIIHGVSSPR